VSLFHFPSIPEYENFDEFPNVCNCQIITDILVLQKYCFGCEVFCSII
jgi:hypothetical protein